MKCQIILLLLFVGKDFRRSAIITQYNHVTYTITISHTFLISLMQSKVFALLRTLAANPSLCLGSFVINVSISFISVVLVARCTDQNS